jgi:hypothetical protein
VQRELWDATTALLARRGAQTPVVRRPSGSGAE